MGRLRRSRTLRKGAPILVAFALVASLPAAGAAPIPNSKAGSAAVEDKGVEGFLARARKDPGQLRAFLYDLPKGGDLHTHLSGAAAVELLITLGAQDGMCINLVTLVAANPPCAPNQRPAQDAVTDPAFRTRVIEAWSMEGFQPGQGETGHDHFFATFGKTGAITGRHRPEMLAQVVAKAAEQNEIYMETMTTRQFGPAAFALSQRIVFDPDLARMRDAILADGALQGIVAAAVAETDSDEAKYRQLLQCGTPAASPGCDLVLRYIHQVSRTSEPKIVFLSMVYGFELAEADGRNVALNLVSPEDNPVALRDYRLHMRMLNYLRGVYSKAHITLHAGEIVPGLVPPEELRYHIREAVVTGHAERIGHGVDVRHEDDWAKLMGDMASRHVMVEVPLTSNAQILEVTGHEHPFPSYRAHGVPVGLATDDEGISRIDLTNEHERAVTTYKLTYRDLKTLSRTVLDHAFLPGQSLWRGPDDFVTGPACAGQRLGAADPTGTCQVLLDQSPKAALQWHHETLLRSFEQSHTVLTG